MKIHHIGYLVKNIKLAIDEFIALGYKVQNDIVLDEIRNIKIAFLSKDDVLVELVAANGTNSVISNLHKKIGNAPYHICYECEKLCETISELESNGYMVVKAPEIAPAILGKEVVFLYNPLIGMIELVEK